MSPAQAGRFFITSTTRGGPSHRWSISFFITWGKDLAPAGGELSDVGIGGEK